MDETNVNPAQAEPVTEVPERDFAAEAEGAPEEPPPAAGKEKKKARPFWPKPRPMRNTISSRSERRMN